MDSELVPLPLAPIAPILRVANEIRMDNPRVAYLCCFYAFEKIRLIDLTSRELGVRQFKTDLLHRLEKESIETKPQLAKNNDAKEILLYYQNFYEKYIKEGEHTTYPEEMAKLCEIATVLYEVLKAVAPPNQIDSQTQRIADDVKKKRDQYPHYNILPLYAPGIKPAIMELPEIEVAVKALRNIEDLPMPTKVIGDDDDRPAMPINDIFDWLSSIFGFQKGNVANQREHLILLLANINARHLNGIGNPEVNIQLSNLTIGQLEEKIFANYICWCKFLHCKPSTERFAGGYDKMQMKLVYISLFLLIWGEASNVRLLPECLCYIFHHMAKEIYVITYNNVHPVSGEAFESEVRDGEYFLRNIISPLYVVLDKETKRSRGGRESNSKWRNYDDFNEFFWTDKCFSLGWPMNPKSNFFRHYTAQIPQNKRSPSTTERSEPKANFVELRTFWHLYRNFDRMWIFLVLAFQALVIIAWNSRASLSSFFDPHVFASMLSIFVTYSFLNLLRATLDIALILSAWESLKTTHMVRLVLKFSTAAFWALASAFEYRSLVNHGTGLASFFNTKRSLYGLGVAIYLAPNLLDTLLFSIPSLRRAMYESKLWIITILLWWTQEPQLYVGRDMYESWCSQLKYTLFWVTLLISKLAFSYYVEMLPLVRPTKEIMGMSLDDYQWHELFPNADNLCVVIAIWAPIVLVYFMDVQIWYIIYSTLFGVIHGAINHLGEIRTMEILKSRSESLPFALTHSQIARQPTNENMLSLQQHQKSIFYFYIVWNELIISMRMEDLLSNRDRDLLLAPLDISSGISVFQWPPYLLASKISTAIDIAGNYRGRDDVDLFRRIKSDNYMNSAVIEFYEGLKGVLNTLFKNESDKMIVQSIFTKIEQSIQMKTFLNDFWTDALFSLSDRLEKLFTQLLSDDEEDESFVPRIVSALQDAMETVIHDFMINGRELLVRHDSRIKEERFGEICHSIICSESLKKMVKRLHIILTVRESAKFVPTNLEARRRITFFADSLYMNMPPAPKVRDMFSFSVLTPYYKEDVLYTDEEILKENKDGISIMFYMQKIYPDEWCNFMERIQGLAMYSNNEKAELTRQWVSCRGQTLFRTVRGIMYYREALELQYLLESIEHNATSHGYIALDSDSRAENKTIHKAAQALADLKFTYVVSCQIYDALKKSEDPRDKNCYRNILNLMLTYPSLRVAYIHAALEPVDGKYQKVYYSVLVKGGDSFEEEIYRIKLPGPPTDIGEAKAENQNHAIIFTRGEALQKIDTNQDSNFGEAFKLRNVLEEFKIHHTNRKPTILGIRDRIFTGSVSSLSWLMSNQENSSATIGQRILANPLRVRFHYGRNDIFDRLFHITRGGVSKASKVINRVKDDVFAGFNSTLRGGLVTHHEYIQMGRWCDVGINQISLSDTTDASGNGEQTLSRDVHRLGRYFDFFRMLSLYYTTVGFYFSSVVAVVTVYVFLYGRLYIIMSGAEKEILKSEMIQKNMALVETLATQFVIQMGLFLTLPMVIEMGLEKAFRSAFGDFVFMQLQLAPVFFTFRMGTKAHHYEKALLYGTSSKASIRSGEETATTFVVTQATFSENYRLYSRSHFVKGLELLVLLIVCHAYGDERRRGANYVLSLASDVSLWLLVVSWLFAPFLFNPSCFNWPVTVEKWREWESWLENEGGIGVAPEKSWESWWEAEHEHLNYMSLRGKSLVIFLALRFFAYQYGIVYHLNIAHRNKGLMVYGLSWVFTAFTLLVIKISFTKTKSYKAYNIYKAIMYFAIIAVVTDLFLVYGLTVTDVFASLLAFLPSAWAFVLIGQVCRALSTSIGVWESVKELAKACDFVMGSVIFGPVAVLSWFSIVSKLQKRLLFYQEFIRGF